MTGTTAPEPTLTPPAPPPAHDPAHRRRAAADLRRRRLLALGGWAPLAALAAGTLAACSAPVAPLRAGSIAFPGYELLHLAAARGLMDSTRVRLVEMRANTDTLQGLAVGQLEAAALTLDEFLTVRADGMPLRIVAVLDESAGADVVLARRPMARLAELAGRRVGVEAGAVGGLMLAALLDKAGLGPADVERVPVTLMTAARVFDEARLDAVVTAEPYAAQLEARGAVRIFDSSEIPGRIVDVLVAREDAILLRADAVRALVDAHFDGLEAWRTDPAGAARHIAPRLGIEPEAVAGAFRGLHLPDRAENARLLGQGALLAAAVQLQHTMVAQGLAARPQPVLPQWIDPRFVAG